MKRTLLTLALAMALTTPAHAEWNPNGDAVKTAAIAHTADLVSTAGALAAGAAEMNPLGIAIVPLKIAATAGALPLIPESEQVSVVKNMSAMAYGATANNVLIMAGVGSVALPVGIAVGGYLYLCDAKVFPEMFCPFTETVIEEMDRRIARADDSLIGFILTRPEADRLVDTMGYLPGSYKGIEITVEAPAKILIAEVNTDWEYCK